MTILQMVTLESCFWLLHRYFCGKKVQKTASALLIRVQVKLKSSHEILLGDSMVDKLPVTDSEIAPRMSVRSFSSGNTYSRVRNSFYSEVAIYLLNKL